MAAIEPAMSADTRSRSEDGLPACDLDLVADRAGDRSGWVYAHSLALACFTLFAIFLLAQSLTGWQSYNDDQLDHGEITVSYRSYLTTGDFVEATLENWESEFLQMGAFVLLTVFLVQRGSGESKEPGGDDVDEDPRLHRTDPSAPWPVRKGGLWLKLYENSLLLAFLVLFLLSMLGHALGGLAAFNVEQQNHGQQTVSLLSFATSAEFWFQSFQNWQSEFLAVGSIVVLTVVLRQRGSAESNLSPPPMPRPAADVRGGSERATTR